MGRRVAMAWLLCAILFGVLQASGQLTDEQFDRIKFGSKHHDKYREITYWGIAQVDIADFRYGTGDAERLKLVAKDPTDKYERLVAAPEIKGHFLKEFRRLFGDLPFNDLQIGYDDRFNKFYKEWNSKLEFGEFRDRLRAAEEARRRSLYGGRAGAIYCDIKVKRREFPIVYTIACDISAEDDLRPYFGPGSESAADMGFSSPEHIGGEIKRALSEMLKEKSVALTKIRKYGNRE